MPVTYVALLRGINVGGKNKLPMKDLIEMFVEAGCGDVRVYIQSGNVIFRAAPAASVRLPSLIAARISKRFGYNIPLVLRTPEQIGNVIRNNPFLKAVGHARRHPETMKMTPHPPSYLGHPLLRREGGDPAKRESRVRGFFKAGVAEKELYVLFLADLPALRRIQDLDPDRSPPDEFKVRGQEIYLRLPNGAARTKLTNQYFESKLRTVSTARNCRTVTKLFELMEG